MKRDLFPVRKREDSPTVVVVSTNRLGNPVYAEKPVPGRFYRVFPKTEREVLAIQMLENQRDKFAPASRDGTGNGVIISAEAMAKLDAKMAF